MKLYDGKKMVNIEMNNWTGNGYTPDWSIDFFEAGNLEYDEDLESYIVEDVAYCIEQAMDWKNADGDFYEPDTDTSNRNVDVEEIDVPEATSVAFRIRTADTWDADDCEGTGFPLCDTGWCDRCGYDAKPAGLPEPGTDISAADTGCRKSRTGRFARKGHYTDL